MTDTLGKVISYLRTIERRIEEGDLEGAARDTRLAIRLCEGSGKGKAR